MWTSLDPGSLSGCLCTALCHTVPMATPCDVSGNPASKKIFASLLRKALRPWPCVPMLTSSSSVHRLTLFQISWQRNMRKHVSSLPLCVVLGDFTTHAKQFGTSCCSKQNIFLSPLRSGDSHSPLTTPIKGFQSESDRDLSAFLIRLHHRCFDLRDILYNPSAKIIAYRSYKAIISFGHADDPFRKYPGFGPPQIHSLSIIPNSLRRLKILLGREFSETDYQVLATSLEYTRSHCGSLESVSIIANAHSWVKLAAFVRKWCSPPVVRYKERIIDADWQSEVLTRCHKRGSLWECASHISFPVDRVVELADSVCKIPQVTELSLLPATEKSRVLNNRRSIVRGVVQLLRRLPDLRKISLPLELSSRIDILLTIASSLHHCSSVELIAASVIPITQTSLTNLSAGFRYFDHLRKLGLPAYILNDDLCVCLGELQGLQHLTIMATSPIPVLSPANAALHGFPVLRTLKISGSKALSSDVKHTFRTFVLPRNNALRKVLVDVVCLSRRKEMKDTLSVLVQHRRQIRELVIRINGVHASERNSWMDLSLLSSLPDLRMFRITHPRPLPLTDRDIGSLIRAWPLARFLSFNPRPTLPPWTSSLATLNCLTDVVNEGNNLLHFGIYLDPRPSYNGDFPTHMRLQELDLGEVVVDRRTAAQVQRLFPNAKRS